MTRRTVRAFIESPRHEKSVRKYLRQAAVEVTGSRLWLGRHRRPAVGRGPRRAEPLGVAGSVSREGHFADEAAMVGYKSLGDCDAELLEVFTGCLEMAEYIEGQRRTVHQNDHASEPSQTHFDATHYSHNSRSPSIDPERLFARVGIFIPPRRDFQAFQREFRGHGTCVNGNGGGTNPVCPPPG